MGLLESGIFNLLISFLSRFFTTIIQYCFMCKLLPNRLKHYSIILIAFAYATWFNVISPGQMGTTFHVWMNILINALTYFIILFFFQGKLWHKLMVWIYFDVIKVMCEVLAYVPILLYQANRSFHADSIWLRWSTQLDPTAKLFYFIAFFPLLLLFGSLSVAMWRRLSMEKFHPFYLLFIILPMGIKYTLTRVFRPGMGDWFLAILMGLSFDLETSYDMLSLFGVVLCLVSSAVIFCFIRTYGKNAAVEAELRETKRIMEMEQARYHEMEERSEALAKIRHDFNNQLAAVTQLARLGESDTAQELIDALAQEINRTQ